MVMAVLLLAVLYDDGCLVAGCLVAGRITWWLYYMMMAVLYGGGCII